MEPNKIYGYARVSTTDQNPEMQKTALAHYGCTTIVEEHISGVADHKPALETLLLKLTSGDTLVVWKLDRLGRSTEVLARTVRILNERNIHFVSLTEKIDTTSIQGRLFFNIMATIAEFERELIRERIILGVRNAMINGTRSGIGFGRPRIPNETFIQTQQLVSEGLSLRNACAQTGISLVSFTVWRKQNGFSGKPNNNNTNNKTLCNTSTFQNTSA